MSISRAEALAAARKLCRSFASAPDPKQRARAICGELLHASDWSGAQRATIEAMVAWLQNYPSPGELKPRCEQLLTSLG